jgi:serine/threonine-protein kinase
MSSCPDEETLLLYVDGGLDKRREALVRGHINDCDVCRSVLADVVRDQPGSSSSSSVEASTAADGLIVGKYKLLEQLGEGGMGRVYRARHVALDRDVAIKFLRADLVEDSEIVRRFEREARAAAALSGRHVVQILDIDWLPTGAPFIVMEYLVGADLGRTLGERGPLPIGEAVRFMLEACTAISAAHERGIIHRDLKPHNLFLAIDPKTGGTIKVLDFGLAKRQPDSARSAIEHSTAGLIGSPFFMSPEQVTGATVDHRTDIWSLGATFYMMLTGHPPFQAPNAYVLLERILDAPAPRVSARRPNIPPLLDDIVEMCLRKKAKERWATVDALANAIRSLPALAQSAPIPRRAVPTGKRTAPISVPPSSGRAATPRMHREETTLRNLDDTTSPTLANEPSEATTMSWDKTADDPDAPSVDPDDDRTLKMR